MKSGRPSVSADHNNEKLLVATSGDVAVAKWGVNDVFGEDVADAKPLAVEAKP